MMTSEFPRTQKIIQTSQTASTDDRTLQNPPIDTYIRKGGKGLIVEKREEIELIFTTMLKEQPKKSYTTTASGTQISKEQKELTL